jgi:hypothetical protein
MLADQKLHLDHKDDRSGYLGFSHAECNDRAAAEKVNAMKQSPRAVPRTQW